HVGARLRPHRALALLLHLAAGAARSLLRSARRCGAARLSPEAHLPGLVGLVAAAANALRTRLRLVRLRTAARHGALRRLRLGDLRPLLVLLFLRDGAPVLVGARHLFHDPARDGLHPRDRAGGEPFRFVLVARLHPLAPGARGAHHFLARSRFFSGSRLLRRRSGLWRPRLWRLRRRWPGRRWPGLRRPRRLTRRSRAGTAVRSELVEAAA